MANTLHWMKPSAMAAMALCAFAPRAFALPPPPYAVVDISRSKAGLDASSVEETGVLVTGRDRSATGFGITLGWRFTEYLAAEGGFHYLGQASFAIEDLGTPPLSNARLTVQTSGMQLALAGNWPVHERLSLEGRAGVFFGRTETRTRAQVTGNLGFNSLLGTESRAGLTAGVGAVAAINESWALRAGFDYYEKAFGKDARRIGLGVRFNWP
jgi:opacity protein-like surface antigen